MVEKDRPGRIKLFRINDRSKTTLEKYIIKSVYKETKIHTDCWKGYYGLKHIFNNHSTANQFKYFKDSITHVHTNTIEGKIKIKNKIKCPLISLKSKKKVIKVMSFSSSLVEKPWLSGIQ
ncbi:hypothetical protein NGRA_0466 [Nosema granulosis]|uniref:ISXO2-like transposase domain-containing protein n=1 Tax=Nosema granulosis TaxID=83296 RepID=A0A9P6H1B5_9MICR|nr:hypothetical protein NGRA_0466 [Nosema granulosis]